MVKILEKQKALRLRKSGYSIKEIADSVGVSKSTVSGWCKDISLSQAHLRRLKGKSYLAGTRALLLSAENKRKKRIKNTKYYNNLGIADVGNMNSRDIEMVALGLYWGEGYKQGSDEWGFTNSDPAMINFMMVYLEKVHAIDSSRIICRVSINKIHKHRDREVREYWSKVLKIPLSQFSKTSFIKSTSKKIYPKGVKHYGTMRIKVRSGTNLRRRILGSLMALSRIK